MEQWRNPRSPWVAIDDDLNHRREAFYRLYHADNVDVRAMWIELDDRLAGDERAAFVYTVVLATDEIILDERLPVFAMPSPTAPRLRTRVQRLARKLAEQLQLLQVCTPPRCTAKNVISSEMSVIVESLVRCFKIGQVYQDHDQRWRKTRLGIEYTTNSKRGWLQHRRASDVVRHMVIKVARDLIAEIEDSAVNRRFSGVLSRFIINLEKLPDAKTEHGDDLIMASQKSGYHDWLRCCFQQTTNAGKVAGVSPLSYTGWATLAAIITGDDSINADDISHAVQAWRKL